MQSCVADDPNPGWWVPAWGRTGYQRGVSQISVVRWGACLQKLHISARSTSKAPHRSGAWEHPSLGSTGVVARADSLVFLWEII
jgi:hypothetical protein